ncbi:MAG: divergent polysaccharide deacetylase family protein [Candidatus Hydrogenedens sp.]|nr:divergent polysaccharide deacetylase family protein [Candidatus Hydrogenedens sp.]
MLFKIKPLNKDELKTKSKFFVLLSFLVVNSIFWGTNNVENRSFTDNFDIQHQKEVKNGEIEENNLGACGVLEQKQKPKIAIILDDGGYRNPSGEIALELPNKIDFSILPDTHYGKELAKVAGEKGFEIMIHMPMQTKHGIAKGSLPCELLVNMSEDEIKEKTKEAIKQFPNAKGVNNHTGSVFSLDEDALRKFMKVLKKEKLFFVDSIVVSNSKAFNVAVSEKVPALQRDVFLDHEYTKKKIQENIKNLKKIAQKKGRAIGIGHFKDLTIQVLKEELPNLEKQGFELVHVSELFP